MGTDRDDEMSVALHRLPVPEHRADFWDDLDKRLAGEPVADELSRRRARRLRRPGLWMLSAAAAVALVVAAAAVLDGSPKTRVRVVTPPTTTSPPTTISPPSTTSPPTTTPAAPTTTTPGPIIGTEEFPGIYPVTTAQELAHHLQLLKDGEDLQPLDLDGVVRQYLTDHGVSNPTLEPLVTGEVAAVRYSAGMQSGTIRLQRMAESVYVVTSATTELIQSLGFARTGTRLDLTVDAATAGTVLAKVGPLRSEFTSERTAQATPGTPRAMRLTLPQATEPALLRVEIDTPGSGRGFAEARVTFGGPAGSAPALGTGSALAADRLGPVVVGMSFATARQAAAAPVTLTLGAYCDSLVTDDLAGVSFVRTLSDVGLSLIFVDNQKIRTSAGVGVGSTAAEVVRAHGNPSRRTPEGVDPQWLVYFGPQGDAGPGLRFTVVDGRVASMTAGLGVMAEESCA